MSATVQSGVREAVTLCYRSLAAVEAMPKLD